MLLCPLENLIRIFFVACCGRSNSSTIASLEVPAAGWTQWFLFIGLIEKGLYTYDPTRAPGDYKNAGVLGVPNGSTMTPGEGRNRKLNSELANGRLVT